MMSISQPLPLPTPTSGLSYVPFQFSKFPRPGAPLSSVNPPHIARNPLLDDREFLPLLPVAGTVDRVQTHGLGRAFTVSRLRITPYQVDQGKARGGGKRGKVCGPLDVGAVAAD